MSIRTFFSTSCETRELHVDPELRTRYYRNKFKDIINALHKVAELNAMKVRDVNEVHKEVYMLGNGFDAIVTIAQISPIEAGIDLKVNSFSAIGMGKPKKKALKIFQDLKGILNFKGVSLHP
ncbi:MAG: hypothetical protein JEZ05_08475 [Tenericutes bacterium]|nr:hypothetical protein [Mycoplasmatota bacterium]